MNDYENKQQNYELAFWEEVERVKNIDPAREQQKREAHQRNKDYVDAYYAPSRKQRAKEEMWIGMFGADKDPINRITVSDIRNDTIEVKSKESIDGKPHPDSAAKLRAAMARDFRETRLKNKIQDQGKGHFIEFDPPGWNAVPTVLYESEFGPRLDDYDNRERDIRYVQKERKNIHNNKRLRKLNEKRKWLLREISRTGWDTKSEYKRRTDLIIDIEDLDDEIRSLKRNTRVTPSHPYPAPTRSMLAKRRIGKFLKKLKKKIQKIWERVTDFVEEHSDTILNVISVAATVIVPLVLNLAVNK